MNSADVLVIGAGIIGAACAWRLAIRGQRVILVDDQRPGATAAGMGHVVLMDDDPRELMLSAWSLRLWQALAPQLPVGCAWRNCGTLWLAENAGEMELAREKQCRMAEYQANSELQSSAQICKREPLLRKLAGGLWVPGDGILYAPNVARWFMENAGNRLRVVHGQVSRIEEPLVVLQNNSKFTAAAILVACGYAANNLLDFPWLRAKKGLLAITDRYPPKIHHQLLELGYGASAHANSGTSVAFNVQPRPTGQLLIGSSRQYDNLQTSLDHILLASMLKRACQFLPSLAKLNIIRCWSGFRAASQDGAPLLGPHPTRRGIWLALGHEGLGVTTAPASACLLSSLLLDEPCELDPTPWLPQRFFHRGLTT